MRLPKITATLLATTLSSAGPVAACGGADRCDLPDGRHYYLAMPAIPEAAAPGAIVFAHGYRGTAEGVMRNRSLVNLAGDLGVALIAIKSADDDWILPGSPRHPDSDGALEFAYVAAVLDDAQARFGIDRARVLATGFSAGGMMTWNLACARPDLFAGFAPMSGTFWVGPPAGCAAPVRGLVHFHGDADPVVPQTGRAIGPTVQGDVAAAMAMYAQAGGWDGPPDTVTLGDTTCDMRRRADGAPLAFCAFPGGHDFRTANLRTAWDWLIGPP